VVITKLYGRRNKLVKFKLQSAHDCIFYKLIFKHTISTPVCILCGWKCTLAASHALPMMSHTEYAQQALEEMGLTDEWMPDRYIMLTARCSLHNNFSITPIFQHAQSQMIELRFYVPLDIKIRHFRDVLPSQSLGQVVKKI